MNERLENKLRRLRREDLVDWAGERTTQRGEGYLDRVCEVSWFDDCIAANVLGGEMYTTNVYIGKCGEWKSVCTCPVGVDCKHGVALALFASKWLNTEKIRQDEAPDVSLRIDRETILAAHTRTNTSPSNSPPPSPTPPETVHFRINENPFGRFTAKGGNHAKRFSFRVVTEAGVYHWDFIISTLIYSIAKGGLFFSLGKTGWREERNETDPAMFTCSCGDPYCGGFGDQIYECNERNVLWRVYYNDKMVELEFDRIHYEYWALLMLWRMRGSPRLRKDPWKSVMDNSGFSHAVSSLLDARPRLRAIWELIRQKRYLDEADLDRLSAISPNTAATPANECRKCHFFPKEFSTRGKLDLRQEAATFDEKARAKEKMRDVKIARNGLFVYSSVIGRHWEPTDVVRGNETVFVREPNNSYDTRSIRVDDVTRGITIGYLKLSDAHWLSDMMDRHGLVLKGHVEPLDRDGKMIPVRIDLVFQNAADETFDWGDSLPEKERLYFEMLRAVALRPDKFSASMIQTETKQICDLLHKVIGCPEIAFLAALLTSGAKEVEYRLTEEEVTKRRIYCEKVRKALICKPAGGLLDAAGLKILPLKAVFANPSLTREEAQERMRCWIRLSWLSIETGPEPKVHVPGFPHDATGFAVFRGHALIDVCLSGIPVCDLELFNTLAHYDGEGDNTLPLSDDEAFSIVKKFLGDLPVREHGENGSMPRFWLEHGIHEGHYELDGDGRLLSLRILMLNARREWID